MGGTTRPSSSACVMIIPPISRVETPQEVVHPNSSLPCSLWNLIPQALEKFCPRKWEVPACRALRSCIMASMQRVHSAGKAFRFGLFPTEHGHGQPILRKISVQLENQSGFIHGFLGRRMHGVPFLPEKFRCAQERRGRISQRTTLAHWLINRGRSR